MGSFGSAGAKARPRKTEWFMAQFLEFIGNHLMLATLWMAALAAIVFYHQRTASKGVGPTAGRYAH